MKVQENLYNILNHLNNNDYSNSGLEDPCVISYINDITIDLINNPIWNEDQISIADSIIRISNIAYNNTSREILPLDDGIYDQLLVVYSKYNPNYQIGANPIMFEENPQNEFIDKKIMCTKLDDLDNKLYIRDIWEQHVPVGQLRPYNMCIKLQDPITKRLINTTHKYPELVGTLDKCKFVLNNDAVNANVFDKQSVQIFERDFIHKCLDSGVISQYEEFEMVCELKYDGISVEAEVCGDTIISALSRGDTGDNIATDLTPIFKGYRFYNAGSVPKDIKFGIKFEAVITYYDLDRLSAARGKSYKNGRNAIIGLCGASDAYLYTDYITLIPLSTSLEMDRETELKFLNKYYNSGQYNRHVFIKGNYQSIMFQVKQFTESAEEVRKILPYMIDGVVVSFTDKDKINKLGRINSVNKYSMAIKFNPKSARTIFLGYSYSVGKSGDIIPMAHFKPCEFIGCIHYKQTIHSYKRFNELNLTIGEEINIDYVNDVITYITKPDNEYNRNIEKHPVPFITNCPYCGSAIEFSESGKSAKCPNINCHERKIMRMVDMIDRFGFKDFSEEKVRALDLTSFDQLMNLRYDDVSFLGPINSTNLMQYINNFKFNSVNDYMLMSAFSFDGMAEETWKLILKQYSLTELLNNNFDFSILTNINGIGEKTVKAIINGLNNYHDDIIYAINNFNIINYKNTSLGPRVAITGFRDGEYINIIKNNGYDISDKYSVTKDTFALIAGDINSNSSKIMKARKYNIPIFSKQSFIDANGIKL